MAYISGGIMYFDHDKVSTREEFDKELLEAVSLSGSIGPIIDTHAGNIDDLIDSCVYYLDMSCIRSYDDGTGVFNRRMLLELLNYFSKEVDELTISCFQSELEYLSYYRNRYKMTLEDMNDDEYFFRFSYSDVLFSKIIADSIDNNGNYKWSIFEMSYHNEMRIGISHYGKTIGLSYVTGEQIRQIVKIIEKNEFLVRITEAF